MRVLAALLVALVALPASGQGLWSDLPASALRTDRVMPTAFRALALDRAGMDARLASVPLEVRPGSLSGAVAVPLPLPGGEVVDFRLVEAPILAPGLQARYPHLRTYAGVRADDPTTSVRVSVTPAGVGAWIMAPSGVSILDPVSNDTHMAYHRDAARAPEGWAEARAAEAVEYGDEPHEATPEASGASALRGGTGVSHGETLRLYRLAVATTGEYAQFHGGTVADAMAAIVVAMSRVNGLYERDVAIRMLLVENNDKIVFTDPLRDPFTDGSPFSLFSENQVVVDDSIGTDNYDIGHVFSTGGGGVAGFGVVCRDNRKAQGVTGLPSPIGDPFYVDYVAHEMGHQFRANHTFNGTAGACSGGNRNPGTAFEPGSGSTIMAYAGICGSHNIQSGSDAYFHTASLREIWSYVTDNVGATCAQEEPTGNLPPVVTVPNDFAIPIGTPFVLVGGATDETPGALTYVWEEVDLGTAGAPPGRPGFSGDPPLFRSFTPTASPVRFFPQRERYIGGLPAAIGEGLPINGGALRFRLTVRDNQPGAGAVADAETVLTAYADAGPFAITAPNEDNQAFEPGAEITLAWDVANTASLDADGNPDIDGVDEDTIDIFFSRDNGASFTTLVLGTPNDGVETIRLPFVETPEARILIRAGAGPLGSSFYDVNDVPFRLQIGVSNEERPEGAASIGGPWPNPVSRGGAWMDVAVDAAQTVEVDLFDALGRRVRTLFAGPLAAGAPHPVRVDVQGLAPGAYVVRVAGETAVTTRALTVIR